MSHPCKISLEYKPLDTYPAKKNNIPHFLNQSYINSYNQAFVNENFFHEINFFLITQNSQNLPRKCAIKTIFS